MLTIDQIKDVSFEKGRGYRVRDVDAFIDEVIITFEQMKKEKSDLIRKMDILATRVEQYRADEETVRNALLTAQKAADQSIKDAKAQAAAIISEAEAKSNSMAKEANAVTAKQKEVYLKLKADSIALRNELEVIYNKHLKTIADLPTDAALIKAQEQLDVKYPTAPVEEPEETVQAPVVDEEALSSFSASAAEDTKFSDLKFGDNYDVDAD